MDYQGAKDKTQAESNVSAGMEKDSLSCWVTPCLEEMSLSSLRNSSQIIDYDVLVTVLQEIGRKRVYK